MAHILPMVGAAAFVILYARHRVVTRDNIGAATSIACPGRRFSVTCLARLHLWK